MFLWTSPYESLNLQSRSIRFFLPSHECKMQRREHESRYRYSERTAAFRSESGAIYSSVHFYNLWYSSPTLKPRVSWMLIMASKCLTDFWLYLMTLRSVWRESIDFPQPRWDSSIVGGGADGFGRHDWRRKLLGVLLTNTLFLVPVAVALLGEGLVAEGARVGPRVRVRANVVLHIGQLVELLVADFALHLLVLATCLHVDHFHGSPQLSLLLDHLVFLTRHLAICGNIEAIFFVQIFCSGGSHRGALLTSGRHRRLLRTKDTSGHLGGELRLAGALVGDLQVCQVGRIGCRAVEWWWRLLHCQAAWCQRKALLKVQAGGSCWDSWGHLLGLDLGQFLEQVDRPCLRLLDRLEDASEDLTLVSNTIIISIFTSI